MNLYLNNILYLDWRYCRGYYIRDYNKELSHHYAAIHDIITIEKYIYNIYTVYFYGIFSKMQYNLLFESFYENQFNTIQEAKSAADNFLIKYEKLRMFI